MKRNKALRVFTLLLSIVCLCAALPFTASAEIVDSGICGDDITWTMDKTRNWTYSEWDTTLSISGTGPMYDYGDTYDNHTPWTTWHSGYYVTGDDIDSLVISDGITRIGNNAFYGLKNLRDIHIPNSVECIGECAFFGMHLSSISLPENLIEIENSAFMESYLANIVIPRSVRSIGFQAFKNCYYLTSVDLMNGVTSIEDGAFAGCVNLESIDIPNSVTSIGRSAFADCTSLASIIIPNSVTSIGGGTFAGCTSLSAVELPDSIASIGDGAFRDCDSLTSIEIPSSVTSIGIQTFDYCTSLTDVYYSGSEAQWEQIKIEQGNDDLLDATIHFGEKMPGQNPAKESTDDTLPTGTRYVPYSASVPAVRANSTFTVPAGSLPKGLSLSADGVISGIPTELGTFTFTVTETGSDGTTKHACTLPIFSQTYADVEASNAPGYGFVETATDDGRIQDQHVANKSELTDQTMHCEGDYAKFVALYLDAKKLTRNEDYTAVSGSTKITVFAETIGEAGGGTHTVAAEFRAADGKAYYTVQNYTVTGIASKEVHVQVKGETVIWTDSEPYIDTNNRTMTPFRAVGEALGLTAGWDSTAREASFTDGSKTIYFPIGSTEARTSDGGTVAMDTSAVIVNGRTYAPIRYLAEFFGFNVGWNGTSRTVTVD